MLSCRKRCFVKSCNCVVFVIDGVNDTTKNVNNFPKKYDKEKWLKYNNNLEEWLNTCMQNKSLHKVTNLYGLKMKTNKNNDTE